MLTLTEDKLTQIFIEVDDFLKEFQPQIQQHLLGQPRQPDSKLHPSEIITIAICYHFSRMDCFKSYYLLWLRPKLRSYFPHLPSYERFVTLKKHYLLEMFCFLSSRMAVPSPKANYIDSKKLESCHIKRASQHKVMKGLAAKGKTSVGWFYGLKIHLIVNEFGQLCNFTITAGNIADNNEDVLRTMFKNLYGRFFGDKGYLTKLKDELRQRGVELITKRKKNMKKVQMSADQAHYLKQRGLIETVLGLLTFQTDIDHTRHRSLTGMFINLFTALIAYTYLDNTPMVREFKQINQIESFKDLLR